MDADRADRTAPRTALEEVLVEAWADVLGVGEVGVHDDFFELGGDSLTATRIIGRLRQVFEGGDVTLRTLFTTSTVAAMAAALTAGETVPGRLERIAQLHLEVARLSPDEVEAELARQRDSEGGARR
ncbi:phosphopantetheine-binding protein [Saccharothrix xinjiangensis]|uniref:Phosphopantetheine-binding protein n=1 Tax=Saccharothrix xinjiangensis TaxID=204798 RepID=A0ABV9Y355_9PSEU